MRIFIKKHYIHLIVFSCLLSVVVISAYFAFGAREPAIGRQSVGSLAAAPAETGGPAAAGAGGAGQAGSSEDSVVSNSQGGAYRQGNGRQGNREERISTDGREEIIKSAGFVKIDEAKDEMPETRPGDSPLSAPVVNTATAQGAGNTGHPVGRTINASLWTNDKHYDARVEEGATVYNLMEKLRQTSDFTFAGEDYAGLGFFVESVNGLEQNSTEGRYWIYYVNGQSANVGVSNYIIKSGDIIEWRYGAVNSNP